MTLQNELCFCSHLFLLMLSILCVNRSLFCCCSFCRFCCVEGEGGGGGGESL